MPVSEHISSVQPYRWLGWHGCMIECMGLGSCHNRPTFMKFPVLHPGLWYSDINSYRNPRLSTVQIRQLLEVGLQKCQISRSYAEAPWPVFLPTFDRPHA